MNVLEVEGRLSADVRRLFVSFLRFFSLLACAVRIVPCFALEPIRIVVLQFACVTFRLNSFTLNLFIVGRKKARFLFFLSFSLFRCYQLFFDVATI